MLQKSRLTDILGAYRWRFIVFLIIAQLVPMLYGLSNTYWIGHLSSNALAITEQYEFPALTIEIINEMMPFGVLALVAQNFTNKDKIVSVLRSALIIQLIFSAFLMSIILIFTPQFVSTIGTPGEIIASTTSYLTLQSLALPFSALAVLLLTALYSMRKARVALCIVAFSVALNIALDIFLISDTSVSLNLGIEGSALGYVISQAALFTVALAFAVKVFGSQLLSIARWSSMARPLFAVGGWTGLDSLVRNIGYMLVPLNVLNVMGTSQFGGYQLAMTVLWTVIIPILAISQGTSILVGNYYGERRYQELKKVVMTSLFLVTIGMGIIAVSGVFFWEELSRFFNQNDEMVTYSTATFMWLIIPYFMLAMGMIIKSVFFGTGKTKFILYTSSICNFGLIIPFWLLARANYFSASFDNVMLLFVIVFAVDLVTAIAFVRRLFNQMNSADSSVKLVNA